MQEAAPVYGAVRPIRLKPSSSDYAAAVRTTADAMNLTGPAASKTKPDALLLSLTSWES
ncbi:hypothetical protein llg_09180 [Luteolibacter sp. LG18]|nr:hypothetical protein llg_09180 [Luteolibacter sp. LG18]